MAGRDIIIKKFSQIVNLEKAKLIEQSIYNFSTEYIEINDIEFMFESIYNEKVNEIYKLLTNKDSNYLIDNINKNKFDLIKIAFMRPDELNPNKYEKIIEKHDTESNTQKNQTTSSTRKCSKCKAKKVQITQKQTRSADEPATEFVECKECGYVEIIDF